jgi:hypothetical protein
MGDTKSGREKKGLGKQEQLRRADIERAMVVEEDDAEKYLYPDEEELLDGHEFLTTERPTADD